jgi:hypothetical protein
VWFISAKRLSGLSFSVGVNHYDLSLSLPVGLIRMLVISFLAHKSRNGIWGNLLYLTALLSVCVRLRSLVLSPWVLDSSSSCVFVSLEGDILFWLPL